MRASREKLHERNEKKRSLLVLYRKNQTHRTGTEHIHSHTKRPMSMNMDFFLLHIYLFAANIAKL